MALEHAILVSLAERPGTGYEIGQQFDRSIGYYWSATHQQIYRTLKKLHTDGLVTFESIAQDGRPDKKVYTISDEGRKVLSEWAMSPTPYQPLRSDIGVKLRAAEFGDLATILGELKAHRDEHVAQLAVFTGFEKEFYPDPDTLHGRKLYQYLVLRGGILSEEAFVAWCDEVIATLERQLSS